MLRKLLLGTALATFAAVGSANAFVIDTFDSPASEGQLAQNTTAVAYTGAPTYRPGGTFNNDGSMGFDLRTLDLGVMTASGGTAAISSMSSISSNENGAGVNAGNTYDVFAHNQGNQNRSFSRITWEMDTPGEFVDLTNTGAETAFRFSINSADQSIGWGLAIFSTGGNAYTFFTSAFDVPSPATGNNAPYPFIVPFTDLIGAVNLNEVTKVVFVANLSQGAVCGDGQYSAITDGNDPMGLGNTNLCVRGDVGTSVDIFDTIPEPGSMTLLGAGLAGIGLLARRRRKSA